jgi:hypothetical protein
MKRILILFTQKRFYLLFILIIVFILLIAIGITVGLIPVYLLPVILSTTLTTLNSSPRLETGSSNISVEVRNIGFFNIAKKRNGRIYSYTCNNQEIFYEDFQYQVIISILELDEYLFAYFF